MTTLLSSSLKAPRVGVERAGTVQLLLTCVQHQHLILCALPTLPLHNKPRTVGADAHLMSVNWSWLPTARNSSTRAHLTSVKAIIPQSQNEPGPAS